MIPMLYFKRIKRQLNDKQLLSLQAEINAEVERRSAADSHNFIKVS